MKLPLLARRSPGSAALLVVALLVAGCGGSTAVSPSSSPAEPSPAASAAATAPPGTTPDAGATSGAAATAGTSPGAPAAAISTVAAATAPPLDCSALVATPAQTEGPYFKAGSPERTDLREPGMAGTALAVVGHVVDGSCRPVAGAVLDVWQADASGTYDNAGYTLRGHLASGADGSFRFVTVVPGLYTGRTEHIHVKVTPPGGATLTTQLYFPGVAQNDADGIYDPAALLAITQASDGLVGVYTFVLGA